MLLWFVGANANALDLEAGKSTREILLGKWGLADVFGSSKVVTRGCDAGPGGQRGTMILAHDYDDLPSELTIQVKHDPSAQEWVKRGGDADVWCGKLKGERVEPDSLLRAKPMSGGSLVRLGDGQQWLMPEAYYRDGEIALTRTLRWGSAGTVYGPVVDSQRAFGEAARTFFEAWLKWVDGAGLSYDFDELIRLAVLGLQQNYRIGVDEAANLLGLFDETNIWDAALATIGYPTIQAMAKHLEESEKKNNDPQEAVG